MSFDEHYMDTKVHETMDLLYEDQKTVPKKLLNRKPFIRNDGSSKTNRSGKHATFVKNDAEETAADSVIRVLNESANEYIKLREQESDYSMSFDEHYMDTTVDEIMDLLYESRKHATVVKNDTNETAADSMVRVLNENANAVLEETMNLILAATRMVEKK
ncbi:hypothetical protein KY285_001100 [Solanum tuberosum]|nr:hypothetical protein KY285_001100 [Solanum tuberosum]